MKVLSTLAMVALLLGNSALLSAHEEGSSVTPENAQKMLREGNERFARSLSVHPHTSLERRDELVAGQEPFATVLGCSDSRVPAERIFDQGLGDIFTVRVAGEAAAGEVVLGSIEYGVLHAGTNLIVVLGHEECGAVKAALTDFSEKGTSIDGLLKHVIPAADNAKDGIHSLHGKGLMTEAIERNVLDQIKAIIKGSPKLRERIKDGKLKIVGGVYSLHTGRVSWLGEHPSQQELLYDKGEKPRAKVAAEKE